MKKFEDVDVIDSLRRIMNVNTKHYKSDFVYDAEKIRAAAVDDKSEDIRFCSCRAKTAHIVSAKETCLYEAAASTTHGGITASRTKITSSHTPLKLRELLTV